MSNLSIRLPADIDNRLDHLASETGRTKTYYVREAIIEYIDKLEDIYLALGRFEKPSSRRWTLDELEEDVDLEG